LPISTPCIPPFAAVRRLLAPLGSWRGMMGVQKVAQFWSPQ